MQTAIFIYYFALGPHPGTPARQPRWGPHPRRLCLCRLSRLGFVAIDCPLSPRLPGAPSGAGAFAACRGSALWRSTVRFHNGSPGHRPARVPSPLVAARLCGDRLSAFTTAPGGTVRRLCLRGSRRSALFVATLRLVITRDSA